MKYGQASVWAQRYIDAATKDSKWDTLLYADFEKLLRASFEDKVTKERAREEVEHFQQGSSRVDEYIVQLQGYFDDAGITDDDEKQRLLEKSAKKSILHVIYNSDKLPEKYIDFETKVVNIG